MLNTTILATIQSLSPLWARQISEQYKLGSEYTMLFSAVITEIAKYVNIREDFAIYLSLLCATGFALHQFGLLSMPTLNMFSIPKILKSSAIDTVETVAVTSGMPQTQEFLHAHPEYFTNSPAWSLIKTDYVVEPIIYDGNSEYVSGGTETYKLIDGVYTIKIDKTIHFTLTVTTIKTTTKDSTSSVTNHTFAFYSGTMKQLTEHVRVHYMEDRTRCLYYNRTAGTARYKIQLDKHEHALSIKGSPRVWNGFFHADLPRMIKWVDAMNSTSTDSIYGQMNQLKHMGVICHGPPGTGKSTLTRIVAQYTGRHIMSIRIQDEKTLSGLYNRFYNPKPDHDRICNPNECVYELEEFDKAVLTLVKLKEKQEKTNHSMYGSAYSAWGSYGKKFRHTSLHEDDDDDTEKEGDDDEIKKVIPKKKKKEKKEEDEEKTDKTADPFGGYDWSLDDLLTLLCGSIRHDRMIIIATCNDIEAIRRLCPALLRPGRLTPILFDNGTAPMLIEIVKKYCGFDITPEEIPTDYTFQQASLIEFLMSQHENMTKERILTELPRFVPADTVTTETATTS